MNIWKCKFDVEEIIFLEVIVLEIDLKRVIEMSFN